MTDSQVTIQHLKAMAKELVLERDWQNFHSPKNLSMSISIEAAELMEKFIWHTTQESFDEIEKNRDEIQAELADILLGIICFANAAQIDLGASFSKKIQEVAAKYPVEKAKGSREKYTKL